MVASARVSVAELDELPPFAGGAVGFFGYDLVRTVEPLGEPNPDPLGLPDMALMVCELMLAFDHHKHEVTVLAYAFCDGRRHRRRLRAAPSARSRTRASRAARTGAGAPSPRRRPTVNPFESNLTREQFEANVSRIIEYIRAGDAFQVVPSQRFSAPAPVEAFSIYRGLRTVNPSPYMYFLDFGDFQIAGASPEPLVKVSGRRVETRPIAGTYPRGGGRGGGPPQRRGAACRPQGAGRARDARRPRPQRPRPRLRVRHASRSTS